MLRDILDCAKVSKVKNIGAQAMYQTDAVRPGFKIKVRRGSRWLDIIDAREFHTCHVTREQLAGMCIEKDNVMYGMSRSIMYFKPAARYFEEISSFDGMKPTFGR